MANEARNIVIIGRTGSGKSSLCNTLSRQNAFAVGDESVSRTKFSQAVMSQKGIITYRFIDTIGLGDTKLNTEENINELAKVKERIEENGIHQILFTIGGRITQEEVENFEVLKVIFGPEVVDYCTIIRTKFSKPQDFDKDEEDFKNLIREEGKSSPIVKEIKGKIIYVNNPSLVENDKE